MYHRFGEVLLSTEHGHGWDYNRDEQVDMDYLDIHLTRFREVYQSSLWFVRIYEVLKEPNR